MADTTSLMSLPVSSQQQQQQHDQPGFKKIDNIEEILNGLNQASETGATQLSSRDIPKDTYPITQDPTIHPNYPYDKHGNSLRPTQEKYISNNRDEYEDEEEEENYRSNKNSLKQLDDTYTALQIPIMLAVLFFLFQLPFMKKYQFMYLPVLFQKDGNWNISGLFFNSALFGSLYFVLLKIMTYFS